MGESGMDASGDLARTSSVGSTGSGRSFRLQPRPPGAPALAGATRQGSGLSRASSGKKLSIKPFQRSGLPPGFEEEAWSKLEAAVQGMLNAEATSHCDEELYGAVRDLCDHGWAPECSTRLRAVIDTRTRAEVVGLRGWLSSDDEHFLAAVGRSWEDRSAKIITIARLFAWLDTTYLRQQGHRGVWDQGLELFASHLRGDTELLRKLQRCLLDTIKRERLGNAVDRRLLSKLTRMLDSLLMYKAVFEEPFLQETRTFYDEEAAVAILSRTEFRVCDYLHRVEQRFSEENERLQVCLLPSTRRPLITVVETCLVKTHAQEIVSKGLHELLQKMLLPELGLLYSQLGLPTVECRQILRESFQTYVKTQGARRVMDEQGDGTLISDLLGFKNDLDVALREAFAGQKEFEYSLRDAFSAFVNMRADRAAELLARFLDQKQRATSREVEEEMEHIMERCLDLFRMTNSKDVFLAFYQKDFAKRLLLGRSASTDNEKSFIMKLKKEGGPGFTNKLEGMLNDMTVSADIMEAFKRSGKSDHVGGGRGIELGVQVLTQSYWPSSAPVDVKIPPHMSSLLEAFRSFYLSRHKGRRLQWQASLCMCTVKAAFPSGRKELIVSLYQALVLLLFNDAGELTVGELQQLTGIEAQELRRVVQSLAFGPVKVLRRGSKRAPGAQKGELADEDSLGVNEEFRHKQFKVKINQVQAREAPEETKKTNEQVLQDRIFAVDACIVRMMKSRRSMQHTELISAVFGALKFPVTSSDLKKRIESLIERDYLRRAEDSPSTYQYVS
eukprot:Hpha_TRINITY_DN15438_c5_g1::TRINITY_DN15438_c5_g1_i1::g.172953::m.172953/K10609/CUL4; cullin 4